MQMFRRGLMVTTVAVLATACTSTTNPGTTNTNRHFLQLGFGQNCRYVLTQDIGGVAYDSRGDPKHTGTSSCIRPTYDLSVYSSPVMYVDGKQQQVSGMFAYYLKNKRAPVGAEVAFPPGLTMVSSQFQFSCVHGGAPRQQTPLDCRKYNSVDPRIDLWTTFPACWDGHGTTPTDVAYQVGGVCPAGFGSFFPVLQLQFQWSTPDATQATFSTGPVSTFKAIWTNGWKVAPLAALMRDCIDHPTPCGDIINYFHRSPLPKSSG